MRLPQLNRLNFDREVHNKSGLVLVLFESLQCVQCRAVLTIIREIAQEAHPVAVASVNVDWNPRFAAAHDVHQIPTLILYKNGMEQTRIEGVCAKEEILERIAVHA